MSGFSRTGLERVLSRERLEQEIAEREECRSFLTESLGDDSPTVHASAGAVATDEELRKHVRAIWPRFFVADDDALFESLRFSADSYNPAFTRELPRYDVRARMASVRTPTRLASLRPIRIGLTWSGSQTTCRRRQRCS